MLAVLLAEVVAVEMNGVRFPEIPTAGCTCSGRKKWPQFVMLLALVFPVEPLTIAEKLLACAVLTSAPISWGREAALRVVLLPMALLTLSLVPSSSTK